MIRFEWDPAKARTNLRKHGVSFDEARSVFFDESALEFDDPAHSSDERRFLLLGRSVLFRTLVVCHCFRESDEVIRLISARRATPKEEDVYERRGRR